ncbi:hypothetical protein [Fontivita pretiosa]|uniref:hypothetical protein n=1 Tax=Fontivita pretiosa TaxID=2989684 RepID=UPI003D17E53D
MRIEAFKRWHWAILGLGLGLIVSFWRGLQGSEAALDGRMTLDTIEFERLLARGTIDGKPLLRDIEVHPMPDGSFWITAEQLLTDKTRDRTEDRYIPVRVHAPTPYVPTLDRPAKPDPKFTVVDYLRTMKAKTPVADFSTRWWDREPVRSVLFAAVGLALLGGAWPLLIPLLTGVEPTQRRGGEKRRAEPEYDLSRFGRSKAESVSTPAARRGLSDEEIEKIRQLEAELERSLRARQQDSTDAAAPAAEQGKPTAAPSPTIRPLAAAPLEQPTVPEKPKEHKEFAGEFYPTETHVKKKH